MVDCKVCGAELTAKLLDDGQTIFMQELAKDGLSGTVVEYTVYPKGTVMELHRHSHGHGIYVIEGELVTEAGTFSAGTLIWHQAGALMRHGASDAGDCRVLFIYNGDFDIEYV